MKLNNGEIFAAKEPLGTLLQMELPVKVSHDLAVMAGKLAEQYKVILDVMSGLRSTYGTPDGRGGLKTKKNVQGGDVLDLLPENETKLTAGFNELMDIEVELVIQKVTLPAEIDGKPLKIKPVTLMALEKFVGV